MSESVAADRAATWYANGSTSGAGVAERPARARHPGPRALEARGYASLQHLLVQLSDVALRPRFAEFCRAFGDIVWCDDLDDLVARAEARQALAVVVDVVDRSNRSTAAAVTTIRAGRPELPIVLWCDRTMASPAVVAEIMRAGVSGVVFRDETDVELRLLSAITRATDVTFQQLTDQALSRRVPEAFEPVIRFVLDRAGDMPPASIIAETVGLTPPQLTSALRRAGLPPLGVLSTWSRLLTAAYRLERSTDPLGSIARSVGFETTSGLTRALKRYTNDTARGVRDPGGFGWVLRCFERSLAKAAVRRGP